jgi:hypothetical protein
MVLLFTPVFSDVLLHIFVLIEIFNKLITSKTLHITGVFFKFGVEVGVELSIVNALYRLQNSLAGDVVD